MNPESANKPLPFQRRSIRLKHYDYTQDGGYFVTICAYQMRNLFGTIENGEPQLNQLGRIIQHEWEQTETIRNNVELDAYVIMPNHLHGILIITEAERATHRVAPTTQISTIQSGSLGAMIGQFKSAVTRHIRKISTQPHRTIWQRNYYEHVIRNEQSLNEIRQYIANNPARWAEDRLYRAD